MNGVILVITYVIFLVISLIAKRKMTSYKKMWLIAFVPIYFLFIYFYFAGILFGVRYINSHFGTEIYFGHEYLGLVLTLFLSFITSIIIIVSLIIRKST
jgi:hypothetical protein